MSWLLLFWPLAVTAMPYFLLTRRVLLSHSWLLLLFLKPSISIETLKLMESEQFLQVQRLDLGRLRWPPWTHICSPPEWTQESKPSWKEGSQEEERYVYIFSKGDSSLAFSVEESCQLLNTKLLLSLMISLVHCCCSLTLELNEIFGNLGPKSRFARWSRNHRRISATRNWRIQGTF